MARTSSSRRKVSPTLFPEVPSLPRAGPRRVLLTGASGFVGRHILTCLLDQGWEVVAVSRRPERSELRPGLIQVAGDLRGDGWQTWAEHCAAVIHLVGIIREAPRLGVTFDSVHRVLTERVVEACQRLGIPRLVHMSALGVRPNATTAYHRTKLEAEEKVRQSGLRWTIFRPSLVFGPGDGFDRAVVPVMRRLPFFPVLGDGKAKLQPIAVEEVARCFVAALECAPAEGRVFELGGPQALTFDEVLRRIARGLGVRRPLVHLPLGMARLLAAVMERLPGAPITRDQLTMLLEGSVCDTSPSLEVFGVPQQQYEGPVWWRRTPPPVTRPAAT